MTNNVVDTFDREKLFIEVVVGLLVERLQNLKVAMKQITTLDGVRFDESCREGTFVV